MNRKISSSIIEKGISYLDYRMIFDQLVAEKKTSGDSQSEFLVNYTALNLQRTTRIEKTAQISEETRHQLQNFPYEMYWLVLSEVWCGDAAQNLPVISKMADLSPNIDLKIIWRDENPDFMDQYLTNGGRSIPKLVAVKKQDLTEMGTWGPRPLPPQQMVMDFKEKGGDKDEFMKSVQQWYNKDKSQTIQIEFSELLKSWQNS